MSSRQRLRRVSILAATAFSLGLAGVKAPAQIRTEIVGNYRGEWQKQPADPEMNRERGTQPQDWLFALPAGVRSRQITFTATGRPATAESSSRKDSTPAASGRRSWSGTVSTPRRS